MARYEDLYQHLNAESQSLSVAERAELLIRRVFYDEAAALLEAELESGFDAELAALMAKVELMRERYEFALDWLEKSPEPEVAQMFADHFEACRQAQATHTDFNSHITKLNTICDVQPKPGKLVGVSACLIVKNEEANLERCLASLKGRVDQIVVVDTGSTDRTVEIAQTYGATIGFFEWCGDFAAARNASLDLATQPWILWIDADEELTPDALPQLQRAQLFPFYASYVCAIHNMDGEGMDHEVFIHKCDRLFQNHPLIRFEGRIHEGLGTGITATGLYIRSLYSLVIKHYGYSPEQMLLKAKDERNRVLIEESLAEDPTNTFHLFNLAMNHSAAGRTGECIKAAIQCVEGAGPLVDYVYTVYQVLLGALAVEERTAEVTQWLEHAREHGYHSVVLDYIEANARLTDENLAGALESIERTMDQDWPEHLTGDMSIVTYKRHLTRGQILIALARHEEAEPEIDLVLSVHPSCAQAQFHKGQLLFHKGEAKKALPYLEQARGHDESMESAIGITLAATYRQVGRLQDSLTELNKLVDEGYEVSQDAVELLSLAESVGDFKVVRGVYDCMTRMGDLNLFAQCQRAQAAVRTGDVQTGLGELMALVQQHSTEAQPYFSLADALYGINQFVEAQDFYRLGLERSPEHAEGWFCLANTLAQMGAGEAADRAYAVCLDLAPGHAGALHNRALIAA